MRILVIEDDREAVSYPVKALGEAGHVADSAYDGEAGFERATGHDGALLPVLLTPRSKGLF